MIRVHGSCLRVSCLGFRGSGGVIRFYGLGGLEIRYLRLRYGVEGSGVGAEGVRFGGWGIGSDSLEFRI